MAIDALHSTLQSLQSVASMASGIESKAVSSAPTGFADELQQSLRRVNKLQIDSQTNVKAFQAGDSGLTLNDVMIDMQKASLATNMATQVRNKLVSAYKDIMAMPV
ncbi:flagellar hook-basal body complex protein FliE [Pseudomonas serbica]|jgi:flagellar hook-basal body complex protein FliE|uniref:flagellar hook-basal body complex protein FliE n=1 Tax=Pseudomonas serbica TaxID=2965074 RepID=UPI00237A790A|nr:flagellar hook-basal body complex protein FliE [Pseudomonas serbica]